MPSMRSGDLSRLGLAAFLIAAGTTHFTRPEFYDEIVPGWMPGHPRAVTHLSGVGELAAGATLLSRRTSGPGGWAALVVFIGVYPANIQMAIDVGRPSYAMDWLIWFRLLLQFPLFAWAIRVARRSGTRAATVSRAA